MPERSCPSCHGPVAAHQTLCPTCRTPVPAEAGPVASDSSAFTFTAPPPRQQKTAPVPEPVIGSPAQLGDLITGSTDRTAVAPVPQPQPQHQAWGASAGVIGTPGAAVLDERGNLPGGVVGLVAAALVVVGVFLPWIGVEGRDVSGWAASGDAKILLGLAAVATVIAALLIGGARSLVLRLGLVGLGVIALGFGIFEIASARGIEDFDVSAGIGIPVVIGGGIALAVAGALTRHRRYLPSR